MGRLLVVLAILGSSFSAFAQSDKVSCGAALIWLDSTQGWGIDGESGEGEITLTENTDSNYSGTTKISFKNGEYNLYIKVELGTLNSDTWSTLTGILVKVENGKNKTLGGVIIPNTSYPDGAIGPAQVDIMSSEAIDEVSDIETALKNSHAQYPNLRDGTVLGSTMQCYRK